MLVLVCLSLVASTLAQFSVPAVSGQANCMSQCMLLPPAQKRDCIQLCVADAGKPSWTNRPVDTNWRNFEDNADSTWFPTGAAIDQVPSMWESSKFTDECERRCVKLPYPFSVECSAQCPNLNDFGAAGGAAGGFGLPAMNFPTGRAFASSKECYKWCMAKVNNDPFYSVGCALRC